MKYTVTFILPALNEAGHLKGAISTIHKYSGCFSAYEIIVVDNGSTDDTVLIAQTIGAEVYCKPRLNVGALRNFGASRAKYDYLVFIDADVYLTPMWQERILQVLDYLDEKNYAIAGSTCGISANPSLIESCWWGQAKNKVRVNYINSGHMIVRRQIFNKLGGFDEKLKTGEDSEFCQRPRDVGVEIVHDANLHVIHEGYPKTFYEFFRRERWHGLGDYNCFAIFKRSKPALISTMQIALLIAAIAIAVATHNPFWLFIYPAIFLPICFLAAIKRCRSITKCLLVNIALYFIYFWARALAFLDTLLIDSYVRKQ